MALQGVYGLGAAQAALQSSEKDRQNVPGGDTFAALLAMASTPAPQAAALTPAAVKAEAQVQPSGGNGSASEKKTVEKPEEKSAVALFLEYMNKTPAERWREAWLKQHKLTEADLEAMSPEKRRAIEDQMAQDMKEQIERSAEKRAAGLEP